MIGAQMIARTSRVDLFVAIEASTWNERESRLELSLWRHGSGDSLEIAVGCQIQDWIVSCRPQVELDGRQFIHSTISLQTPIELHQDGLFILELLHDGLSNVLVEQKGRNRNVTSRSIIDHDFFRFIDTIRSISISTDLIGTSTVLMSHNKSSRSIPLGLTNLGHSGTSTTFRHHHVRSLLGTSWVQVSLVRSIDNFIFRFTAQIAVHEVNVGSN
mmetsp:Transcript_16451/g.27306  ORF Transcript_16451/g.27306 Transcript_16451/m.27306 type:complete len:215 (-) Transcript_16451:238-882(-)